MPGELKAKALVLKAEGAIGRERLRLLAEARVLYEAAGRAGDAAWVAALIAMPKGGW